MIVLTQAQPKDGVSRIIGIFGLGLIGKAILKCHHNSLGFEQYPIRLRWTCLKQLKADLFRVREYIVKTLEAAQSAGIKSEVTVIWSAGSAGFNATMHQTDRELVIFDSVLEMVTGLLSDLAVAEASFHLISSLGGLFEGRKSIDGNTVPDPKRPYGILKLNQELRIRKLPSRIVPFVYRPSSVYGFPGIGHRMGLIPTLIRNGMSNRVSTIVGGLSTLRDYVSADDVGSFVTSQVLERKHIGDGAVFILASGKPSSIHEIKYAVEEFLGRSIFVSFSSDPVLNNASDITVSSAGLPQHWAPRDLRTGISMVAHGIYDHGALTNSLV